MAMQRMMGEVPKADVVITNPTQYAVALRYDLATMRAPIVVAKGARILAEKIRAIAVENDVPIVRKPELARALYRTIDVNHPVPEDLFRAVAEVLAYVYQIDRREQKIRERSQKWNSSPIRA
jgi:flagellar biosynthetic protein FlhB